MVEFFHELTNRQAIMYYCTGTA